MNTQVVFLKQTGTVLYTDGPRVLYELDADVTPANYAKDSAQKACFAVVSDNSLDMPVNRTYAAEVINQLSNDISIVIASDHIYANVYTDPFDDLQRATNNKWVWEVEQQ